jgi:hypothetical protein
MWRKYLIVGLLFWILTAIPAGADPQPVAVSVSGAVDKPGDWTAARLKAELAADVKAVDFSRHGQKHTASAISLLSLLKAEGIKTELKMGPAVAPKEKNYPLRLVVVVSGRDGYTATFSVAEILPDFGNRAVWLEMDEDGKPLPDRFGPVSLLVPDDVLPGRWVHGIGTIMVLDASAATTQPSDQSH